jgi:hypothetical protein
MSMGGGRGIHDSGFRLPPWSDHFSAHGTGGNADMRIAAYPFHLPSVRQGVDIQDALVFRKPHGGLHWRSIPFETLQVKPTVSSLMIPLVSCHINSFQRASRVEKPWPGGENRRDERASPHVEL